ncbi:hypothetical protein PAAG_04956 [Paracoccidioides lutzii Pb01]|uniref:Uncharacterized protein n=1 Tax=Paracoccidioides lutzii (strain ATCC MYA-826 / Pb01) TaxID=502779 RepID=C1H220_PARBA|nr:hypothetical protein PAAG_04956 [Paracoccidioides lutzii Pb01]EEH33907.2 hypothetical protein PAAG_04956 [Paracoccidioides lutzii Pb01]
MSRMIVFKYQLVRACSKYSKLDKVPRDERIPDYGHKPDPGDAPSEPVWLLTGRGAEQRSQRRREGGCQESEEVAGEKRVE